MTKFNIADRDSDNLLDDSQLDAVVGGSIQTLQIKPVTPPSSEWTFKDVFAKHTIGQ